MSFPDTMFPEDTGQGKGGTIPRAIVLMNQFIHEVGVYPIFMERCWYVNPSLEPLFEGYYDYRIQPHALDIYKPYVVLVIPGLDPEQVVCRGDFDPSTVAPLYVDGEALFWPDARLSVRKKLEGMRDEGEVFWQG